MFLSRINFLFISFFLTSTCSASQYVPQVSMLPQFQAQNSPKQARAQQAFAASVQRQHAQCVVQAGTNQQAVQECHEQRSNFVVMVQAGRK